MHLFRFKNFINTHLLDTNNQQDRNNHFKNTGKDTKEQEAHNIIYHKSKYKYNLKKFFPKLLSSNLPLIISFMAAYFSGSTVASFTSEALSSSTTSSKTLPMINNNAATIKCQTALTTPMTTANVERDIMIAAKRSGMQNS